MARVHFRDLAASIVLTFGLLVPAQAQGQATIGIYGDPEGTLGSVDFEPTDDAFTARMYVIAEDYVGGMSAYEYGFTGSFLDVAPSWFVLTIRSGGPAPLNLDGCESPFQWGCGYGLGGCVEDDPFVMTEYWLLSIEPLPSDLLLCADRGANLSSFDGEPGYLQCDLETSATFVPAPNPCYDVPDGCLVVNPSVPCGIVDARDSSFGAIKALYGG